MRPRRIGTRHHRLASLTLTSPQTPAADHRRIEQSSVDSVTMRAISCDCGQTTAQILSGFATSVCPLCGSGSDVVLVVEVQRNLPVGLESL